MMTEQEQKERQSLTASVLTWVRTPYKPYIGKMGVGCDCAYLLVRAHVGAGLSEGFKIEKYNADWHFHRNEERYLAKVEEYLIRVDDTEKPIRERPGFVALPGDVLVWRCGRTYSHGAIVTRYPYVVHASAPARIVLEESLSGTRLERLPMRVYSKWGTRP